MVELPNNGAPPPNRNSNNRGSSTMSLEDRPSSARCKALRDADAHEGTLPTVSNFFPLQNYYDASDKLLDAFRQAFEIRRELDKAYVYGIRYCTFCVSAIPHHDYYQSTNFASRRGMTNTSVAEVLTGLEQVREWMDAEEIIHQENRRALLRKQQAEALRKKREREAKQLIELEQRIARQKLQSPSSTPPATAPHANGVGTTEDGTSGGETASNSLEESALAKLQRLSQPTTLPPPMLPPSTSDDGTQKSNGSNGGMSIHSDGSGLLLDEPQEPDGHYTDEESNSKNNRLPPALLPPTRGSSDNNASIPPPPSYHALAKHSYFGEDKKVEHDDNQPVVPTPPSYHSVISKKQQKRQIPKRKKEKLTIRQYVSQSAKRHRVYLEQRKIQISALRTYQGRVGGSTNGCTVISACVVSKHLESHRGITDAQIVNVIDAECIPLLKKIRSHLGLGSGSLIIPSDVHDHMVDHKLLYQHKFVGVAGGNIADPSHFGEVLKMLAGEPGKTAHLKAGATLFFREHVISIVKFPTTKTEAVYDMIDSLPTCNGRASRTRCATLDALTVQLEWYSSHKFSDSNCSYIERNPWDDRMADFDPRVFQAFVWADLPKPTT